MTSDVRVFYESWLEKRAEWRFAWDKRYFTLDGSRLAYRTEEDAAEKKWGTVASLDCQPTSSRGDFNFRVWLLEGGSWTLRAPDRDVYEQWLTSLMAALKASPTIVASPSEVITTTASEAPDVSYPHADVSDVTPPRSTREEESCSNTTTPPSASPKNTGAAWGAIQLTANVEKQAAWTGRWRSRVLELSDGYQLAYRSKPHRSIRQRYTILALDYADPSAMYADRLLLFTTSIGEQFWVRFASTEERDEWHRTVYKALRERCSWQWMLLHPEENNKSILPDFSSGKKTGGAHSSNAAADVVRRQYHCAAIGPGGTGGPNLYVYGGATKWCKHTFHPEARAFLPHAPSMGLSRTLATMQLYGSHQTGSINPEPYEEQQHVKVRPPPLYGASLTTCADSAAGVQLVLVGGMNGSPSGLTQSEVWAVQLPTPSSQMHVSQQPKWTRCAFPTFELPNRSFHDAALLPPTAEAPQYHQLLVTGGLDDDMRTRSECYVLEWPRQPADDGASTTTATTPEARVRFAGYLPEARAFHRTVTLHDGTVVLCGGRGVENDDVAPVLTLPASAWRSSHEVTPTTPQEEAPVSPWLKAAWSAQQGPLPPMPDVAVAVTETRDRVVVLTQLTNPKHALKLFLLDFDDIAEGDSGECVAQYTKRVTWTEISIRVGAIPRRIVGATIHVHQGYLYVLGCGDHSGGEEEPQACGPMRILTDTEIN